MNSKTIDTLGCEFGYELIMVLPYVHYLWKNGFDPKVLTVKNMKYYYYFLNDNKYIEQYDSRKFILPTDTHLKGIHFYKLDKTNWLFPDLKSQYKTKIDHLKTKFDKPIIIISNKFNTEWRKPPVNFISVNILDRILEYLGDKYTIIYNRHKPNFVIDDNCYCNRTFNDFKMIKNKYPNVIDINELVRYEKIDPNLLQLILYSNCENKISVQGGNSVLASCFGGTNLIFARKGQELEFNSFSWYNQFSNTKIFSTDRYRTLLNNVRSKY